MSSFSVFRFNLSCHGVTQSTEELRDDSRANSRRKRLNQSAINNQQSAHGGPFPISVYLPVIWVHLRLRKHRPLSTNPFAPSTSPNPLLDCHKKTRKILQHPAFAIAKVLHQLVLRAFSWPKQRPRFPDHSSYPFRTLFNPP